MFTHKQVWSAIDALAQQNDMSVSRLARNAGLDPTSFNKSKRTSVEGRDRWPSTESLAKVAEATNTSLESFVELMIGDKREFSRRFRKLSVVDGRWSKSLPIPLLGLAQAGSGGYFDDGGFPVGAGWDEIDLPHGGEEGVFALEITGDSMLPTYRSGDKIILSQNETPHPGDRVVVKSREGEVLAKVLARQTPDVIELHSINEEHENRRFDPKDIEWMHRILWASQ